MLTAFPRAPPVHRYPDQFEPSAEFAHHLDTVDPLADYRELFHLPLRPDGTPYVYLCSHSLGLQPRSTRALMQTELDNWALLGVEGHFHGSTPWYTYQELLRAPAARLVGAQPREVIHMNGLTVNLHLLLTSFFRPEGRRRKILIDEPAFPSDLYALQSQLQWHGLDPAECLIQVRPRAGESCLRAEDLEAALSVYGPELAVVWLNAVNFLTGQWLDVPPLVKAAQRAGCLFGLDLAHAAGNVPLSLHDWGVDFAVWCTYKYLCSGPGAVAGCFVHEKHGQRYELPRLAGWWGNDPATRFRMQLEPKFTPHVGADGWQISNPPILALVPIHAALNVFDHAGMPALRARSVALTSYLQFLLDRLPQRGWRLLTPRDPSQRGCMITLEIADRPRELFDALMAAGIVGDFRQPNVLRFAPAPLYNSWHEIWTVVHHLESLLQ
jgi:kynureninase